jgi:cytochrome c oxidase subunit 3
MAETRLEAAHQFDDLDQQHDANVLGMWVFLASEVLFFGGCFAGFTIYRSIYPEAFGQASRHLDVLLGTINTVLLLTSSFTMTLALHSARAGARKALVGFLLVTLALGTVFLIIKGAEYHHKFEDHLVPGRDFQFPGSRLRETQLFFSFYFVMTGMHALHMLVGIALLVALVARAWRAHFSRVSHAAVEMTSLYWHFVDIVWIFLFPLLYLIGGLR